MTETVMELQASLEDLLNRNVQLNELMQKETTAIINRNISSIIEISVEKQDILSALQNQEDVVLKLQNDISCKLGGENSLLKLREIINFLPQESRKPMENLRFKLKASLNKNIRMNKINSALIKNYFTYSSFCLKKVSSSVNKTYSASGIINSGQSPVSLLFYQKA